jgi:3-oxoacyl-[acyl-carrier protein] reductase
MQIDMSENSNRTVLVTGSSRGIGRIISEHLLESKFQVEGVSRGLSDLVHPNYRHHSVDLLDPVAVAGLFSTLRKLEINVDTLINNAGVLTSQYALILDPNRAKDMVLTNLWAPFVISREAARSMRKQKWGRIVHIGSMAPTLEVQGDSIYAACKKGLEVYSNVIARELSQFNITSNVLGISAFPTEMLSQLPPVALENALQMLPIPKMAVKEDIFNLLDFLISAKSSNITAQTIYLGGAH